MNSLKTFKKNELSIRTWGYLEGRNQKEIELETEIREIDLEQII